jgi:site-specific DNA-methyltransferase (adenine-specific)
MMFETFLNGCVRLHCGDSRDVLKTLADASIDSIVSDPPYALVSIVKRFGKAGAAPAKGNEAYQRASAGFMGKQWDTGETAFDPDFWAECLRVLKPGGYVVAFSGTRTYHRMACAIEDAGFEVRDMVSWLYGSGFPKSHNQGLGWGTALKPACEPICMARKPLSEKTVASNVLMHGTGAINVDGCRIGAPCSRCGGCGRWPHVPQAECDRCKGTGNEPPYSYPKGAGGSDPNHMWRGRAKGDGHVAQSGNSQGRWPANVIHDGSEEVVAAFPESAPASSGGLGGIDPGMWAGKKQTERGDHNDNGGSAARFFYTAKADAEDRLGSKHPTVKPVDLMQWLCRLVTPKGGTILDPFAGTGTMAEAAFREGFKAILIEREEEYQDDIRRRMALVMAGPDERARESIKAKIKDKPADHGPLFAEAAE